MCQHLTIDKHKLNTKRFSLYTEKIPVTWLVDFWWKILPISPDNSRQGKKLP